MRKLIYGLGAVILAACTAQQPGTEPDYAATGWVKMSLPELSEALKNGDVSSEALVTAYLERIHAIDRQGPRLQSVISLNENALVAARDIDARRAAGEDLSPLAGIPVLLKDNIETADNMPTTAGALALKDNLTGRDSPLAAGLRAEGAIILGKTNLSQWANFRSEDSVSGWSALGGQVHNPHILDRSPCGSSSGSGAAAAASLAAGAVGTETNGSIICPAQVNGVVGFKPTVGVIPQDFIVPISHSQDTAGPMTKTVRGAAMMMTAMDGEGGPDYAAALNAESLRGAKVGVMRFAEGSSADISALFDRAIADIEAGGAEIVEIESFNPDAENYWGKAYDVLKFEFKAGLNDYLENTPADIPVRTLEDLIAFNVANAEAELGVFDQSIFDASQAMDGLGSDSYRTAVADVQRTTREQGVDRLLLEYDVDVLISPSGPVASHIDYINGDVWPAWAGAGYLAAVAGYPHITVPMGDVHGMPLGLSFMGGANQDAQILSYGYAYEQATGHRIEPQYLQSADARTELTDKVYKDD